MEFLGERGARLALVEVGRRLYQRGLINGGEGNLSCRLGPRRLLEGGSLHELRKPSSELLLHLACYEEREECLAVVHAHPPHAVALTLLGEELLSCMPEAVTALGEVPTARYATPGTERVAESVRPLLGKADCVLMERHGALAMGFGHRAPFDACDKMEMLEGVARVQLLASLRRPPSPLPPEERRILDAQREANLKTIQAPPRPWERDR